MDAKDASKFYGALLSEIGINLAQFCSQRIVAQFEVENPQWQDESTVDVDEVDLWEKLIFYSAHKPEPESKV